jgi:phage shock protein B
MNIGIIAILCVFGVPIIAIICGTIVTLSKQNKSSGSDPKDIKLIQELNQSLNRMEKLIESLETILFDEQQQGGRHDNNR